MQDKERYQQILGLSSGWIFGETSGTRVRSMNAEGIVPVLTGLENPINIPKQQVGFYAPKAGI